LGAQPFPKSHFSTSDLEIGAWQSILAATDEIAQRIAEVLDVALALSLAFAGLQEKREQFPSGFSSGPPARSSAQLPLRRCETPARG
jgi:hypothetical protein